MSGIALPKTVADPLTKKPLPVPDNGDLGMDRPFFTVFNHSNGTVAGIREALQSYGILLGQHTMRTPGDKNPLSFIGIHSINIVGVGKLRGKDVVIYYETFGKNHRDYVEDGFFGPVLRAFPVGFFYQGMAFPHAVAADLKLEADGLRLRFRGRRGQPLAPDRIGVTINGKHLPVESRADVRLPRPHDELIVQLTYQKRSFQTPEEPKVYRRTFFVAGDVVVELDEYQHVCEALTARKKSLAFWRNQKDPYRDFLLNREDKLRTDINGRLANMVRHSRMFSVIAGHAAKSEHLQKAFGRAIKALQAANAR